MWCRIRMLWSLRLEPETKCVMWEMRSSKIQFPTSYFSHRPCTCEPKLVYLQNMGNYELTLVLSPELADARQKTLLAELTKAIEKEGGKVVREDKWGRKTLAYPLKKNAEGVYFLWELELPKDKVAVVNRMVGLEEEVLRHLLVKHEAQNSKS